MARTPDPTKAIKALSGIGAKLSKRIIEELGQGDPYAAYGTIERNPYRLIEVEGIGFKKADKCAMTDFRVPTDDVRRHHAGNQFILEGAGVMTLADFAAERVKLGLFDQDHQHASVVVEQGKVWLPLELEAELGLCDWLAGLPSHQPLVLATLTPHQQAVCDAQGLDDVQRDAVRAALANRVVIIDGGAGCGKTHVVATLTACLALEGKRTRGMAFAGKAADRMREAFARYGISAEASTIHKALGYAKGGFTVDLLAEDLIVVDESSMLPNWLLWAVVQALPEWATLVLVGDRNQLPPIGHGTPFVDAIAHGVPRAHLSKNYRQADQQGILQMAEGVLHRKRPNPASCVQMLLGVPETKLQDTFSTLVQQQGGLDFEGWQAISWKNEDVERYNLTAQALLNPHGQPLAEYPCWKLGTDPDTRAPLVRAEIRTGDKIIIIKNSTLLGIFNGQTGTAQRTEYRAQQVQRKDADGRWVVQDGEECPHLVVSITGTEVAIPLEDIEKQLQLGYVITVHKAQGSDWDRVIIMQPSKLREDSARRWYYTAITRAKVQLVVVSMLTVVGWWQNAAADAPDVPSSLMVRLANRSALEVAYNTIPNMPEGVFLSAPAAPVWADILDHCDVCGRNPEQFKDCGGCNGLGTNPDPVDVTWAELRGNNKASMPILGAAIEAVTQYLDQPTLEGNADRLQLAYDLQASQNELATLEEPSGSRVILGNCLEVLRGLPDNSIDSVVTDPPYGLSFMGKKWDYDVPSVEIWAECLRVLKPGGHLLAFAGTRTQHRMAVRIEDAGFEIRDMIAWVYGSGFPKSLDVSKAIDKAAGAEREVVGPKVYADGTKGHFSDAPIYGAVSHGLQKMDTAPATPAAQQWEGWGTALKPALEPITVARKPFTGTVAGNVQAWGTGAINVDASRVEGEKGVPASPSNAGQHGWLTGGDMKRKQLQNGRWPANFIHDGSEDVLALFPETKSGSVKPYVRENLTGWAGPMPEQSVYEKKGDSGSAARFFYCAKASKKERGEGNSHPTVKPLDLMRYLCRLVTPPGGTVLDPFTGSGTTGVAAVSLGFQFLGIELDPAYHTIAESRLKAALAAPEEESE